MKRCPKCFRQHCRIVSGKQALTLIFLHRTDYLLKGPLHRLQAVAVGSEIGDCPAEHDPVEARIVHAEAPVSPCQLTQVDRRVGRQLQTLDRLLKPPATFDVKRIREAGLPPEHRIDDLGRAFQLLRDPADGEGIWAFLGEQAIRRIYDAASQ